MYDIQVTYQLGTISSKVLPIDDLIKLSFFFFRQCKQSEDQNFTILYFLSVEKRTFNRF